MEKETDMEESTSSDSPEKESEDIFAIEEIEIEEMAIDGVCGVY